MKKGWVTGILNLILCLVLIFSVVGVAGADDGGRSSNPYLVRTFVDEEGREIAEIIVPGRPPEIKAAVAVVPEPNPAMGINILSNVPAFDWSYGCSATSAAMLFGYYDNTGYGNMYAGPTNGGVCPMDNSDWGSGIGGSDGECPLSATHKWIDGRTTRGHVDDYWVQSDSTSPDPFIGNWPEHAHGDCTGDYMGTNQSLFGNPDGETTFFMWTNGDPLYNYIPYEPDERDGCHGMRLFAQSRGYAVATNFSQYIKGQASDPTKGFTFSDLQAEIDAGRPVLIQVEGHTMLGYGYNTAGGIVYLHDTWDHSIHSMTWGGTYEGLQHYGVAVIQLATAAPNNPPNMPSNPSPANHATGVSINADLSWTGGDPDAGDTVTYDVYFGTSASPPLVSDDQTGTTYDPGTSSYNTKHYWKIVAKDNHGAPRTGPLWDFTTSSAPNNPPQLSSPSVQPPSGTPSTGFYYYVNYYDSDGDSPNIKRVYIDGTPYTMSLQSGSAPNGVYRYGPKNLSVGSHNYYFYFEDGKGGTARLPTSGSYSGPVVSQENNPPNTPSNPSPGNHATGVSINADLSWTGSDPDTGDTLTYDVHFGTSTSPPLVSNDQSATSYDPGTLANNTKYYWKIVATDNHGAPSAGPLWDFTTSSASALPCAFDGWVTLDGDPCPGAIVEARVDTTVVRTATVTADSMYFMVIPRDPDTGLPAEGDTLNFFVDGYFGGTDTWESGEIKTLNLATATAGENNPDVATGLATILGKLEVVYGFHDGDWTWYNPAWPADQNTLDTLYMGTGYWINVSEACALIYGANTYELDAGWNLIGWVGYQQALGDEPSVAEGLATISDKLEVVYGFHDGDWTWYNPAWPSGANTLTTLYMGSGYWINVSGVCDLTYGANTYHLDAGWNLIGWLGW